MRISMTRIAASLAALRAGGSDENGTIASARREAAIPPDSTYAGPSVLGVIRTHRAELDQVVTLLLEHETVDGAPIYRIADRPLSERRPGPMNWRREARCAGAALAFR
jgi:hypothetical protein